MYIQHKCYPDFHLYDTHVVRSHPSESVFHAGSMHLQGGNGRYLVGLICLMPLIRRLDQVARSVLRCGVNVHSTCIRSTRSSLLKLSSSTTFTLKRTAPWWQRGRSVGDGRVVAAGKLLNEGWNEAKGMVRYWEEGIKRQTGEWIGEEWRIEIERSRKLADV